LIPLYPTAEKLDRDVVLIPFWIKGNDIMAIEANECSVQSIWSELGLVQ
jgi:hypothetical protein